MTKDELDAHFELEHYVSEKVVKLLKLKPIKYSYPKLDKEDPDGCYPDHTKVFKMPIQICVSEFLEGLTLESNIEEALQKTAIEGPCKFKWNVGYWTRKEQKTAELNNPTWAEVFKVANKAYIDGGCVDHHFLECVHYDEKTNDYEFFFGS